MLCLMHLVNFCLHMLIPGPMGYGDADPYGSHSRLQYDQDGPRNQYNEDPDTYNMNGPTYLSPNPNDRSSYTEESRLPPNDSQDPYIFVDDQIYDSANRAPFDHPQERRSPYDHENIGPYAQNARGPYDSDDDDRGPYDKDNRGPDVDQRPYDQAPRGPYDQDEDEPYDDQELYNPEYQDDIDAPQHIQLVGAPPGGDYTPDSSAMPPPGGYILDSLRRSPSINSEGRGMHQLVSLLATHTFTINKTVITTGPSGPYKSILKQPFASIIIVLYTINTHQPIFVQNILRYN